MADPFSFPDPLSLLSHKQWYNGYNIWIVDQTGCCWLCLNVETSWHVVSCLDVGTRRHIQCQINNIVSYDSTSLISELIYVTMKNMTMSLMSIRRRHYDLEYKIVYKIVMECASAHFNVQLFPQMLEHDAWARGECLCARAHTGKHDTHWGVCARAKGSARVLCLRWWARHTSRNTHTLGMPA